MAAQPRPHWPASPYLIGSDLGLPLSFSSCFHFADQHAAPVLFFLFFTHPSSPISPRGLETLHFAVRTAADKWRSRYPPTPSGCVLCRFKSRRAFAWAHTDCFGCQGYCLEAYVSDKSKDENPFSHSFFFFSLFSLLYPHNFYTRCVKDYGFYRRRASWETIFS